MSYGNSPNQYTLDQIDRAIANIQDGPDSAILMQALCELHRSICALTHTVRWQRDWDVEHRMDAWVRQLQRVRDSTDGDMLYPRYDPNAPFVNNRRAVVGMSRDDAEFLLDAIINSWGTISGSPRPSPSPAPPAPALPDMLATLKKSEPPPVVLNSYARRLSIDVNKDAKSGK